MQEKHFKLRTDLTIKVLGVTLYRIEATKDSKYAIKGQLGGYIEKEENLQDNSWVSDNARISDNALVYGNAQVSDNALVSDNARISDNALVYGNARVSDNALVYGNARVSDNARISDNALVYGNARVSGNAQVSHKMILKKNTDLIYISGLRFNASISLTGINVGCKHYVDLQDFESRYKKEGQDNNYTDIELKYLHTSIKNTLKLINKL